MDGIVKLIWWTGSIAFGLLIILLVLGVAMLALEQLRGIRVVAALRMAIWTVLILALLGVSRQALCM